MPRVGYQTLSDTGPDEAGATTLLDADGEGIARCVALSFFAETEECFVHIDGIHATDEFVRIPPYVGPIDMVLMNPVKKTGEINRVLAYSTSGTGVITWFPSVEWGA